MNICSKFNYLNNYSSNTYS